MKSGMNFITIVLSIIAIILSVYVLLTVNVKKVTVIFNTNSENQLSSVEIKKGESINLPILERDGYEFLGWYIGEENVDSNYKFDKLTYLNAKWEKKSTVTSKKYMVEFRYESDTCFNNCNGNNNGCCGCTHCNRKMVNEGDKVTRPTNPTRNGYMFVEWQLDGQKYDFNTPVTKDIKLVAVWENNDPCKSGQCSAGGKPIIYLYPEKEIDIEVKLGNLEDVTTIYPKYNNSWKIKAYPNGKLIDKSTNRELYSLYWEGKNYPSKVTNEGFVIKGEDTSKFLEEKLAILGLTEREAEEFIIYWLPQMEHNNYNYIKFTDRKVIDNYMPLEISPKPDTTIRIMMEFKPLDENINVKEQKLEKVERKGFTVVEWGGSMIGGKKVN